ncbi:MAG: hypothetical protein C0P64_006570 [Bacillota bacterium]|jgi:hypothetical protein
MARRNSERYRDVKVAVSQFQNLVPEEFPEGPYGSSMQNQTLGKSTPWEEGQHRTSAFTYEAREFHAGLGRQYAGAHPTHDESADD